jgi:hypothetical protein
MARRRRLNLAYLLGSLLLLGASLHPTTAYSAPGDPPSGSPAGAVYQLPLEQGRSDAAPKGGSGTATGAAGATGGESASAPGSGESGSLYRTENNFGSSSRVPGLAASGGAAGGATARGGSGNAGGTAGGNGAGAAGAAIAGGAIASQASDTGNTSVTAGAILLGAIVLLAAAVGLLTRRFSGPS